MVMDDINKERYSRQTLFDQIGEEGQEKLLAARVVVIGIGALGGNIANLLARAGIGCLMLVDRDVVELNNLQRQLIFEEGDVGKPKAEVAAGKLALANSGIKIEALAADVNPANIEGIIRDAGIVLDGTDNIETRFLINDACVKLGIPWVYGGAVKAEGMSMTIIPGKTPCLRCMLPAMPEPGSTQNCSTVGIINSIPAAVASIQVTDAMKLLLGKEISGGLTIIDLWNRKFEVVEIERNPDCLTCGKREFEFLELEELAGGEMDFMMVKTCEADAYDAIPKKLAKVKIEKAVTELQEAGYAIIADAGVMCVVEKGGLELQLFSSGRVLVKTAELAKAEEGANLLFSNLKEALE